LIDSLHHVEKVLVGMFYVEVETKGVKHSPLCLKNFLLLFLRAVLRVENVTN